MDSVLMLAFLSLFFVFFSGNILWRIYLIYRSVNCFMLQSQKNLSLQCYRGTLIQTPENLATHYRSAIKLRESCGVLLLFWIFFENELQVNLRNLCKLDENVISRYLRGNCVVSLGNLLLSEASQKLVRNWSIARESLLF